MNKVKIALLSCLLIFMYSLGVHAETEERHVSPFSEVVLKIDAEVHIDQGSKQSIEINGNPSDIGKIITDVKDRKLSIRFNTRDMLIGKTTASKVIINITIPEITAISLSGSGKIIIEDPIKARIIDFSLTGSGMIDVHHLESEKVSATLSGSGQLILAGKQIPESLNIIRSGSGIITANKLKVKEVTIKSSGSGNCYVFPTEKLNVSTSGSGDIFYNGDPAINSRISGSGSIKKQ